MGDGQIESISKYRVTLQQIDKQSACEMASLRLGIIMIGPHLLIRKGHWANKKLIPAY